MTETITVRRPTYVSEMYPVPVWCIIIVSRLGSAHRSVGGWPPRHKGDGKTI